MTGKPLDWFRSYLSERTQCVSISGTSLAHQLSCGVPQGSVLGPRLFTIYTQPLGDIVRRPDVSFHLYADDNQLYLTCKQAACPQIERETLCRLEACIAKIWQWMPRNNLKLNDNKTEFMLIQSKHGQRISPSIITIGTDSILPSESTRNLDVLFDEALSLSPHVSAICRLHPISYIR